MALMVKVVAIAVLASSMSYAEPSFYIPAPFYFPDEPLIHPSSFYPDAEEFVPFFDAFPVVDHDVYPQEAIYHRYHISNLESRHAKPKKSATTTIRGVAPLCIACSCLVGRKTCQQAGGVQIVTADIITGPGPNGRVQCTPAAPCVLDPPAQLSACDPTCRLRDANCFPGIQQPNRCQNALAAADRLQCGTLCENLRIGAEVDCKPALQRRNVVSRRPPLCAVKTARLESRSVHSIKKLLLVKHLLALKKGPSRKVASTVVRYLPKDDCLPKKLAGVPYCPAI